MDEGWAAAGEEATKVAKECLELSTSLANQCADASVGAGTMPADALAQADACLERFDKAEEAFREHPGTASIADLNEAGRERLEAIEQALSTARLETRLSRAEVAKLCKDSTPTPEVKPGKSVDAAEPAAVADEAPSKAEGGDESGGTPGETAKTKATSPKKTTEPKPPSPAPAPSLRLSASGPATAQAVIRRQKGTLSKCATSGTGKAVVELQIDDSGKVTGTKITQDGLGTAAACMQRTLKRVAFPSGNAGAVSVTLERS